MRAAGCGTSETRTPFRQTHFRPRASHHRNHLGSSVVSPMARIFSCFALFASAAADIVVSRTVNSLALGTGTLSIEGTACTGSDTYGSNDCDLVCFIQSPPVLHYCARNIVLVHPLHRLCCPSLL